jgi:fibronectin-binding autotransporter adhesin
MRVRQVVGLLILFCGFQSTRTNAQVVATWTDSSGNWSNAANWSTLSVPNNGGGTYYNAVINGTGSDTITFDASGTVVNSLMIGAGETFQDNGLAPTLKIGDPSFPAAGSLTNGGTINWGNGSTLALDITTGNGSIANTGAINLTNSTLTINDSGNGNTAVLSGGGTVNLSGGTITGSSGKETFQNNDNTIQGSGTISNLTLVNNGTINANAVGALTITPNSGGFTNNGTVNATGLGGLVINAGAGPVTNNGTMDINNSNLTVKGAFTQNYGGTLTLENGSIGTITGALSVNQYNGTVTVNASTLTFGGDYTNSGLTSVSNGGTLRILGNFTNNTDMDPGFTLSGGSSAFISGSFDNLSFSRFSIDNSALTVQGDFTAACNACNTGISNGATLVVHGNFDSGKEAQFSVTGGSSLNVGGNVDNSGFSFFTLADSAMSVQGNLDNELFNSHFIMGGSTLTVNGTLTNGLVSDDTFTFMMLSGAGNSLSAHAVQNNTLLQVDSGSSLTTTGGGFANNSNGSLSLGGSLNAIGGFTNSGGTVITNPGSTLITSTYSQSAGLTDVSGTLAAGSYKQSGGATIIETGGLVSATTFTATGGTVTVNGILDPTAVEIGSGAGLQGTGTIFGNVAMGGTLTPGAPGTPGTLTINGNYEQLSGGMLQELIGPLSQSFLNVTGDVALDSGSFLDIVLLNGYNPLGQTFNIMDYGSLVGQFSNGSTFLEDGYIWDVTYGQHGMEVTAVGTPEPSSLLLLFLGLAALASYAQQKKSKTQRLA